MQTPIFQADGWYIPEGKKTLLSYRRCRIEVAHGVLTAADTATGARVKHVVLTPDIDIHYFLGMARITHLNGKRTGLFDNGYSFMFSPMAAFYVMWVGLLFNSFLRLVLFPNSPIGLVIGWPLTIAGLLWMAAAMPTTRAFTRACKQAAGAEGK
jgi:hypothetical protein